MEERLRLSGKNSILMTQINFYIKNPVVMDGIPNINLSNFMCLLVDFGILLTDLHFNLTFSISKSAYTFADFQRGGGSVNRGGLNLRCNFLNICRGLAVKLNVPWHIVQSE